jgi:hypothetical protein
MIRRAAFIAAAFLPSLIVALALWVCPVGARAADCRPAIAGGSGPLYTSDSVGKPHPDGVWSVHFCVDPYVVSYQWGARRHDHRLTIPALGMTPAAAWDAFQLANMTTPPGDPSIAGLRAAAETWAKANAPAAPKWLVAKNSTRETRPTYERKPDGTLGAETVILATVGVRCHCEAAALRVIKGTTTYCEARGDGAPLPAVVAVCTRAP